jgi:hypothetical protein
VDAFLGLSFIGLFLVIFAILILPTVFFLLTLQKVLSKCSPRNRTMSPGLVWLQIIPFFGFIWQFFVVFAVANSLDNEFAARRTPEEPKPGQSLGLAMCITRVCTVIPFLGIFAGLASVVLWIVYWVKIAGFSRKLDFAPAAPFSVPPYGMQQVGYPGTAQALAPAAPTSTGELAPPPAAAAPEGGTQESAVQALVPPIDCANCGAKIPGDSTFCAWCGATVDGAAGP